MPATGAAYPRPVLTDPFDVVFTADVARRACTDVDLTEQLLAEYRVFLHECLQTRGLVVAPNGWLVGAPDDPLAEFLAACREDDLVELAPPGDGALDFDELSYGIALGPTGSSSRGREAGGDKNDGDVAFWLPTFGGALIVPGAIAAGRRVIEPLYARLAVVVRLRGDGVTVDDEVATLVIDAFWEVAAEHVELRGLAPVAGVRPLAQQVEAWLVGHLDALAPLYGALTVGPAGRPLRLGHGQTRVPLALQGDGALVIVEIRFGAAGLGTLKRVEHALSLARAELTGAGDSVVALVVADRAAPELEAALRERADVQFVAVAALVAGPV